MFHYEGVMAQFKAAMRMEQDLWWGAPTLLLLCARKDASPTYEIDVSAAMENITLMATASGLGTCILGSTKLINYYPALRSMIQLPEDWWVIVGMCVGVARGPNTQGPPRPSVQDPDFVQWRDPQGDL